MLSEIRSLSFNCETGYELRALCWNPVRLFAGSAPVETWWKGTLRDHGYIDGQLRIITKTATAHSSVVYKHRPHCKSA